MALNNDDLLPRFIERMDGLSRGVSYALKELESELRTALFDDDDTNDRIDKELTADLTDTHRIVVRIAVEPIEVTHG